MNESFIALELHTIIDMLCSYAHCERAKERLRALAPFDTLERCRQALEETSAARTMLDACGSPPLTPMEEAQRVLSLAHSGAMLSCDELESIARFLTACERMRRYLSAAETTGAYLALTGRGFCDLSDLRAEIERSIRAGEVDSGASARLRDVRRRIESVRAQIHTRLSACLSHNTHMFSDSMVVTRAGRYALPVKRAYRASFQGTVIDISSSGGTVFMEPASVRKLSDELSELQLEEENEIRCVLYALSALVAENESAIRGLMEAMEALDFAFAKAQLSRAMDGIAPEMTPERALRLVGARHPLLDARGCVPLTLSLDSRTRGLVVTGPNTGGKTVTLKTVGLLSLMAQCGLHVSAQEGTAFCLFDTVACDVGDGQSISENLSTFSAHMTRVKHILEQATFESLVLLDELGSGTDPAEGMGLAVAVLEELRKRRCMLIATTHYAQVKAYCTRVKEFENARMKFDEATLAPTYELEVGQAGESCALSIARRIGLPEHILAQARSVCEGQEIALEDAPLSPEIAQGQEPEVARPSHAHSFSRGDCVMIYPRREIGIVCQTADARGMLLVQVRGKKRPVNHKRLKCIAPAEEMYPEDYDFSIVFDSVANRKARHILSKRYDKEAEVRYE